MRTDCLRCRRVKGMEASRASQVETARGSGAARTTEKTILFVSLNVFGLRSKASRVVGMVGCLEAQLGQRVVVLGLVETKFGGNTRA